MAQLTVRKVSLAGGAEALAAAAGGGDSFLNTGNEMFRIKNAGGGSINVTFVANAAPVGGKCSLGVAGTTAHDLVVAIPNDSAVYEIGPFPANRFNDANGLIQITYSGVTTVTVEAVSLPKA
jgi:hypothetical protein